MNPKSVFLCELKECSKNKTTCSISDFTVIQVLSLFIAQPAIADENKYIPVPISTTIGKDTNSVNHSEILLEYGIFCTMVN